MEPALAIPAHLKIDNQLYLQVLRRSQSEGPQRGVPGAGVAAFEPGPMAAWVHGRRRHVTEQQRPEHWLVSSPAGAAAAAATGSSALAVESRAPTVQEHQKRVVVVAGETTNSRITGTSEYQLQFAWPPGKHSASTSIPRRMPESVDTHHHVPSHGAGDREAAGLLSSNQSRINSSVGAGARTQEMVYHAADELLHHHQQQQQQNEPSDDQPRRRRYKTEYKKKFRPFSLYQYVDGRFQKSSSEKIPTTSEPPSQSDKDTWYREVLELRKKAGEYKYRGLGGELMSQHMADLYAKQFDVWEQVSRRSSLSALSLAATAPKQAQDNKDASVANSKRGSPAKTAPQSARPGHAQPLLATSRKDGSNTRSKTADSTERARRDMSQHRSISSEGSKSRSKSAKPAKSPAHASPGQQGNVTLAIRPSLGAIFHPVNRAPARSASLGPERRMPKSVSSSTTGGTGSATKTTPVKARPAPSNHDDGAEPVKVPRIAKVIPVDVGKENVINDEPMSLAVVDKEPLPMLIKALPEPTRVKSPEQLVVRSPDPVNWTVPLDTGKTFTVTQNIRGGEGSRPHSELKVSMTVRPLPAAPVHSAPPVAVTSGKATEPEISTSEPQSMQSDVVAPAKSPAGAPDGADAQASSMEVVEEASSPIQPADDRSAEETAVEMQEDKEAAAEVAKVDCEEEKPASETEKLTETDEKAQEKGDGQENGKENGELEVEVEEEEEEEEEVKKEDEVEKEEEVKVVAEEKKTDEPIDEQSKEKRLPVEEEHNSPSNDPLGVATALAKTPKEEAPAAAVPAVEPVTTIVPGTTLRRLEDPTPFLFSRPGTLGTLTGHPVAPSLSETMPKAPRYRVLEAPGLMCEPVHPKVAAAADSGAGLPLHSSEAHDPLHHLHGAPMMTSSSSPYKVLEAPSSPPKSAMVASSPNASPIASRSLASDVLEKARTRFDRFWTKKDSDK